MFEQITSRNAALTAGFGALCVLTGCASSGSGVNATPSYAQIQGAIGTPTNDPFGFNFDAEPASATGTPASSTPAPNTSGFDSPATQLASTAGEQAAYAAVSGAQATPEFFGATDGATGGPASDGWNAGAVLLGVGFGENHNGPDVRGAAENAQPVSFAAEGADFDPSISEDGRTVVFSSTRHSQTADIYRQAVQSTSVVQLTNDPGHDVMPAISPDGSRIAFASDRDGSWDIYVVSVEGGPAVQVTDGASSDLHPTWAPDGRTLAFCRLTPAGDNWEVWTADVDRPAATRYLTDGMFPAWQPGGNKIAFQRSRNRGTGQFTVWTVDVINGEAHRPTEIVSSPKGAVINPAWSHDGTKIAFSSVLFEDQTNTAGGPAKADLWVQNINGAGRVNLTGGNAVNLMPAWGPNDALYFVTNRTGREAIWAIPTDVPAAGMNNAIASEPIQLDSN